MRKILLSIGLWLSLCEVMVGQLKLRGRVADEQGDAVVGVTILLLSGDTLTAGGISDTKGELIKSLALWHVPAESGSPANLALLVGLEPAEHLDRQPVRHRGNPLPVARAEQPSDLRLRLEWEDGLPAALRNLSLCTETRAVGRLPGWRCLYANLPYKLGRYDRCYLRLEPAERMVGYVLITRQHGLLSAMDTRRSYSFNVTVE